jgi:hypothetical protein
MIIHQVETELHTDGQAKLIVAFRNFSSSPKRDKHQCPGGIRTRDPSNREAADLLLNPRSHRDRLVTN